MSQQVNDRSHAQLEKRNRELSILNAIAQALNAEIDLHKALQTTLEQLLHYFELRTGWVWLIHEDTEVPYLAAALNLPPVLADNPRLMEGTSYCYCLDTYATGDLSGAANVSTVTCTRLKGLEDGTGGLRHHASIPLYTQHGEKLGILNVVSVDWEELSEEDLRLLTTVGDMLSIAIERARLFDRSTRIGVVEERNRLAREIHDTLAQGLTAISLQLETADALLEPHTEFTIARDVIQRALHLARTNLDEARRSVLDLRAAPLQGRTLAEAIQSYATEFIQEQGLDLQMMLGDCPSLPVRIEIGLYRVLQESLTNIAKHADAQQVSISLSASPDRVQLIIEDDGRGFDLDHQAKGGFGLISMNERVNLLGGHLEISSTIGDGTRVDVIVPLEA